jgi:RecJ-like exonuclease
MTEILEGKKFSAKGGPTSGWKCAFCGGSGIQPRSLKNRCIACRGKGEVKFEGPVIHCPSCRGSGRASGSARLSCINCRGIGVIEKGTKGGDVAEVMGERLREITKKLRWAKKETEKKTKEIEKRLKPVKPFVKELKKETQWLEKLGNKIKKGWQSLWED